MCVCVCEFVSVCVNPTLQHFCSVCVCVCVYVCVCSSCDSIEKLKKKCDSSTMENELKELPKFKDFYQFTFNFAKNPGQKGLGVHTSNFVYFLFCLLL